MHQLSSQELSNNIKLLKKGNNAAFEKIYTCYFNRIYSFCFSFTRSGSTAEDLTQDIFVKLWNKRETIDADQNFDAFLFRVARNQVYNHIRHFVVQRKTELIDPFYDYDKMPLSVDGNRADSGLNFKELSDAANEIIDNMPPQRKQVYTLCREEKLTYGEVAKKLNISINSVKTHMKIALRTFREQLSPLSEYTLILFFLLSSK